LNASYPRRRIHTDFDTLSVLTDLADAEPLNEPDDARLLDDSDETDSPVPLSSVEEEPLRDEPEECNDSEPEERDDSEPDERLDSLLKRECILEDA